MEKRVGKKELVGHIKTSKRVSNAYATDAVEGMVEFIGNELKKGNIVAIPNLGIFKPVSRSARIGVNPKKPKEKIKIPSSNGVSFRAAAPLKRKLN